MPAVRVIVVRHGERIDEVDKAEWRKIRTPETQHDPPLTLNGWDQAKSAGRKLASILPQGSHVTVYSSPTARTLSTAAAVVASLRGTTSSVTPVYSLNCCAAAQHYGVAQGFPKGVPTTDVMREVPLTCWPPLGDANRVDQLQGRGGGFVNAVKELASMHADGDVIVLITHREGIWQLLRHAGGQMQSGYCNISLFSYGLNKQELKLWDPTSKPIRPPRDRDSALPDTAAPVVSTDVAMEPETLEGMLARGSGKVMIHRGGGGRGTCTQLWRTPGVRGVWVERSSTKDGEVVELLSSPVTSEGKEGDFVLVRKPSGIEGWTKVRNVQMRPE